MLNFCDFIQVYVLTINHHLNLSRNSLKERVLLYSEFYFENEMW